MKKKPTSRLALATQTIRALVPQELETAQGGSILPTGTSVLSGGTSVLSGTSVIRSTGTSVISH